jgi:2-polyprenyl-3-methyl-5-hydroxy-6-metoxy-1,4-benzoquinol methylase
VPTSYPYFKDDVKVHLVSILSTTDRILDVGAGSGGYAHLLRPELTNIDAVEIWEPYVERFNLTPLYKQIFIENIVTFKRLADYNYIIFGDVLEHLAVEDAHHLLTTITMLEIKCLVAVPYQYEQGAYDDNVYETHLQPDLTHDIFLNRYPYMQLFAKNHIYGYYINY